MCIYVCIRLISKCIFNFRHIYSLSERFDLIIHTYEYVCWTCICVHLYIYMNKNMVEYLTSQIYLQPEWKISIVIWLLRKIYHKVKISLVWPSYMDMEGWEVSVYICVYECIYICVCKKKYFLIHVYIFITPSRKNWLFTWNVPV